jgi:hypothetical protein
MNPVTAYIDAIRRAAPSGPAGIATVARASAALVARIKAREEALGRDLTDAETEVELAALGDPADVARRFSERPERPRVPKSHELIDRYVAAVKRQLPEATAKDIAAELHEAVYAKVEGREEELGRELDKDEVAAILKAFGSPTLVAHRYKGADSLLGPKVYPYFWPTARLVMGIVAVVAMIGVFIRAMMDEAPMRFFWQGLGAAWEGAIFSLGIVLVVFIVIDRTGAADKLEGAWNPKHLPREQIRKPRSRFESLVGLFFDGVAIAWWVGVIKFPTEWPINGADRIPSIQFSDAWQPLWWPILILMVLTALVHIADVIHPAWSRPRAVASILGHAAGIAICWFLLQSDVLVVPTGADDAEKFARIADLVNMICRVSLWFTALGFLIAALVEVWRIVKTVNIDGPPLAAR